MTKENIDRLKKILELSEEELFTFLKIKLSQYYNKIIVKEDMYIIADGELPIGLVAHIDTVWSTSPMIIYDSEKEIMTGVHGLGADDRAGIFMILQLLEAGFRPSIIFTNGEECGGIGSLDLVKDYRKKEKFFTDLRCLIELDRTGHCDSVYYQSSNSSYEKWINSFGFKTAKGTFTDISIIAPIWDVAAVNLSVGYYYEHCVNELLYIRFYEDTFDKMVKILSSTELLPKNLGFSDAYQCLFCGKPFRKKSDIEPFTFVGEQVNSSNCCEKCYNLYFKSKSY